MRTIDAVRIAYTNLKRTKFRSFLTVTGVIIGIGSIVLLVSLGVGLQKVTQKQLASFDALTTISVSQRPETGNLEAGKPLDDQSVRVMNGIKHVEKVSPTLSYPSQATVEKTTSEVLAYGVDPDFLSLESAPIVLGQAFTDNDGAVISSALAKATGFGEEAVIGKDLKLTIIQTSEENPLDIKQIEIPLKITGVSSDSSANYAYLSLEKLQEKVGKKEYSSVKVKVSDRKRLDSVREEIDQLGYQTGTIKDLIDQIDKIFLLAQIILGAIGGIGLFVASLGIINTMTISLLERTREIGIMKAVGATNKDVKRIFVYESSLIGFYGGLLGVGISWGIGEGIDALLNFFLRSTGQTDTLNIFETPPYFALTMIGFAILIALFAGIYPARRAKNLSPIQALRHE